MPHKYSIVRKILRYRKISLDKKKVLNCYTMSYTAVNAGYLINDNFRYSDMIHPTIHKNLEKK